jgi:hypothetical protein
MMGKTFQTLAVLLFITACTSATRSVTWDEGGYVYSYMAQVDEAYQQRTQIRFRGLCASACTLYLSLPRWQTCIAPGAWFEFHRPYGGAPTLRHRTEQEMLDMYPGWVRTWLSRRTGSDRLPAGMVTMDYAYARKFMRPC